MKKDTKITESIDCQRINMHCRDTNGLLLASAKNIDIDSIEAIEEGWKKVYGNQVYMISIHLIYEMDE